MAAVGMSSRELAALVGIGERSVNKWRGGGNISEKCRASVERALSGCASAAIVGSNIAGQNIITGGGELAAIIDDYVSSEKFRTIIKSAVLDALRSEPVLTLGQIKQIKEI